MKLPEPENLTLTFYFSVFTVRPVTPTTEFCPIFPERYINLSNDFSAHDTSLKRTKSVHFV